jgi:hypothetical protein
MLRTRLGKVFDPKWIEWHLFLFELGINKHSGRRALTCFHASQLGPHLHSPCNIPLHAWTLDQTLSHFFKIHFFKTLMNPLWRLILGGVQFYFVLGIMQTSWFFFVINVNIYWIMCMFTYINMMFDMNWLLEFFKKMHLYDDWTLSFVKDSCDFLIYIYFMWFIICLFLIFGNVSMNLNVFVE